MSLYNKVNYPGYPFAQTHPDRLAAIAALHGLPSAPIAACRVLEIGCGDGGNLIPMAVALPGARFVGLDLAHAPIAAGNKIIRALKLKNIKLHAADLLTVDASWGEFDYVVTHGLYAWTPPEVRDRILKISKQNLAPEGIAYVSYNALPGSRIRQMLREMMLFQAGDFEEPQERILQAQGLLSFIGTARSQRDPFHQFVDQEIERLQNREPWAFFHDELADVYEPVYFQQFAQHAGCHGLQFLAEANFIDLSESRLTRDAIETLDRIAEDDRLLREQYADFANLRRFRQTLLCHQGRRIDAPVHPERLTSLYASTLARQVAPGKFESPTGARMKTSHPLALATMKSLIAAAPQALPVAGLKLDLRILLASVFSGIVELHAAPRPLVTKPGKRPVASPLVRYQIAHDLPVTTLHHLTLELGDALDRKLLMQLDGSRTVAEITGIPGARNRVLRLAKRGVFSA